MTRATTATPHQVQAFAKRAWIQQGGMTLWLSALVGAGIGILALLGAGNVDMMPGMETMIPNQALHLATVRDSLGEVQPIASYLLIMTPVLLGALVGIVATLTLPGVVADDIHGGGIEVLLAGPIPRRRLFQSYLGASLILTTASWAMAATGFTTATILVALTTGISVSVTFPFVAALLILPLSLGIWSATATLFGALLYPRSLESRAGMNGGPIRLLAIAPSLLTAPGLMLLHEWALPVLALIFSTTVAASALIVYLTARGFRSTRVLDS